MTAQYPDVLILRGQVKSLCATPLETYLRQIRKSRRPFFLPASTACWRGYVASWEVQGGALYLVDLKGWIERDGKPFQASLKDAFPRLKPPVPASWVTGMLRCPEGCLTSYRHAGFASEYERDHLLHVEKGRILVEWLRLNPPEPIWYRIDPEGGRTRFEGPHPEDPMPEDLFQPEETPQGYRYWGQPPDADADAGYVIGGEFRMVPHRGR